MWLPNHMNVCVCSLWKKSDLDMKWKLLHHMTYILVKILCRVKPFAARFTRIRTCTRQSWAQTQFIFTLNPQPNSVEQVFRLDPQLFLFNTIGELIRTWIIVSCYFNGFISFHSIGLHIQKIEIKILLTSKPYALILIGMNDTLNNVLLKYIIWYKETEFLKLVSLNPLSLLRAPWRP